MKVVITGSIAYDYLMRFPGSFKQHILTEALNQVSLSFLVEEMTKHWGGVAANIAFTMAKLGLQPQLMGTVGRDFEDYRRWLDNAGVDTSTVQQHDDIFTASFFCNTDLENNQIASFYSGAMARARHFTLGEILNGHSPDLVVISPNDPEAMSNLAAECRARNIRFVYDPSQQIARLDGTSIRRDMQGAYAMIVNEYEAHMIADKTGMSMNDLRHEVDLLIVTHGSEGSRIYTNGDIIQVPAFTPVAIEDPTGAGDAFRAGFLTGLVKEMPLQICGAMGALCATYVLEHVGTQSHHYTLEEYIKRFRTYLNDNGALDQLIEN